MSRKSSRRRVNLPLPFRLLVMLLALQQFIAPTWHVCSMGGHAMTMGGGEEMSGHHSFQVAAQQDDGPIQPLICFCAGDPDDKPQVDPKWPKLNPVMSHDDHVNCLALLLQTMPGDVATVAPLIPPSTFIEAHFEAFTENSPSLAVRSHYRGRAPPVEI